jgi:hypothetical protein
MRKATYKVGDDAEMSVSQAGGAIDQNVDRWASQFGAAKDAVKKTEQKLGSLKVTIVEIKGTYTGSGMPGAPPASPKDHWQLLGAIVEGTDPPYFFKLTGPEKTVTAARGDFDRLVGSLHPK